MTRTAAWVLATLSVGWLLWALWAGSDGRNLAEFFFIVVGVLGVGLALVAMALIVRRAALLRQSAVPLAITAAALLLVVLDYGVNYSFLARFALSQPYLEAAAAQVRSGDGPAAPSTIGLFQVSGIESEAGDAFFDLDSGGPFTVYGVAHRMPDSQDSYRSYSELWDGWWGYVWTW